MPKTKVAPRSQEKSKERSGSKLRVFVDFSYIKDYNYQITREIGRGGYGAVYKAHEIGYSQSQYAIKINYSTVSREIIFSEISFLELVKEKQNLPKIANLFIHYEIPHIVLEYFHHKPFITFFSTFSITDAKHYLLELLIGLKNLKDLGICHRDIKPGNFLYNPSTKRGMIIDFGLAEIDPGFFEAIKSPRATKDKAKDKERLKIYEKIIESQHINGRNKIGTVTFMPVESLLHYKDQSYSSDIWPVGVIFLQLLLRKYNIFTNLHMVHAPVGTKDTYFINYLIQLAIFFGEEIIHQCKRLGYELKLPTNIKKVQFRQISRMQGFDSTAESLLLRLLDLNHETRISVEQAIQHKFFDEIRAEHSFNFNH